MKCWSDRTFPSALQAIALASRSKSVPVVLRTSHPRPTVTAVRPGASLLSETFPPLLRLTPTALSFRPRHRSSVTHTDFASGARVLDRAFVPVRAKPNDLGTPMSRVSQTVG